MISHSISWLASLELEKYLQPIQTCFQQRLPLKSILILSTISLRNKRLGLDRVSQFALAAATQAWKYSALSLDAKEKERAGVYIGCGMGGGNTIEDLYVQLFRHNADRVKPLTVLMVMNNASASYISIEYGLSGPCLTLSTACASSANAIGEAFRQVSDGYVDVMLAGGAEAFLTYGSFRSWEAIRVLAVEDLKTRQNRVSHSPKTVPV